MNVYENEFNLFNGNRAIQMFALFYVSLINHYVIISPFQLDCEIY